jgi:hypothetical protein
MGMDIDPANRNDITPPEEGDVSLAVAFWIYLVFGNIIILCIEYFSITCSGNYDKMLETRGSCSSIFLITTLILIFYSIYSARKVWKCATQYDETIGSNRIFSNIARAVSLVVAGVILIPCFLLLGFLALWIISGASL